MPFPLTDVATRFAQKYQPEPNSGCWLWLDAPGADGYGRLQVAGRAHKAHRISYQLHCGPIPEGMLVCHRCDNPLCVNPTHLFVGSNADNMKDMARKGRAKRMKNPLPGEANGRALLTEAQARELLALYAGGQMRLADIARRFGISVAQAQKIGIGRAWGHLPRPPISATQIGRWGAPRARRQRRAPQGHGEAVA